ncbi:TRAP transporter substrate-binding protein [Salipiger mucosus]|nr:TRAP transporter substrate-binding protein [Salipiger mucosus]
MTKQTTFRGTALAALLAAAAALPASAETWRMSTQASSESFEGQAIDKFAELVETYTDGEIEVRVYPNEQLGKLDTVMDQLGQGVIQVVSTSVALLGRYVEAIDYTSAPFLFEDYEQWSRFMNSELVQGWVSEAEEAGNIEVLGDVTAMPRGSYRVIASETPVASLEDFDGLRVRQWSNDLMVNAWEHLGAEVRILSWSEVYDGLNRGLIQAVTSPIELIEPQKFYEVAPNISRTNEYPQALAFLVNKDTMEGLSPEMQEAVERAHAEASTFMEDLLDANVEEIVTTLESEGATFVDLDLGPVVERMDGFYQELDAAGELPDGFLDAVAAARTE